MFSFLGSYDTRKKFVEPLVPIQKEITRKSTRTFVSKKKWYVVRRIVIETGSKVHDEASRV